VTEVDTAIATVERQLGVLLETVRATLRDHAERVHPQLLPVGYKVVGMLVRHGPLHPGQVAERLGADKSLVSRTVRQLEELGLLTRESDPADRRACFLVATPEAVRRFDDISSADQRVLYERLRDWDHAEMSELGRLLVKLNLTFAGEGRESEEGPAGRSRHGAGEPEDHPTEV
jgi:DNA-binding MarR family transcriptional regulator